jgi:hypothetical protein
MMHEFLQANRTELISRCREKAAGRIAPRRTPAQLEYGIPVFLGQIIETFRAERTPEALARHKASALPRPSLALVPVEIAATAMKHGEELRRHGFTVDQLVHDYGDLCQALTELAMEKGEPISVDEFHTFNRCLDDAIADAVTAFSRGSEIEPQVPGHELRNLINSAITSFATIKAGTVGLQGSTSALHEATLVALRNLLGNAAANESVIPLRAR